METSSVAEWDMTVVLFYEEVLSWYKKIQYY